MSNRQYVHSCISVIIFSSVLIFIHYYAQSRRKFVSPSRVESVVSTKQLEETWINANVRGRTLISFSRYLNALESIDSNDIKATEQALGKGILRRVFHVIPDNVWLEVSKNLAGRKGVRVTKEGYIGIFDGGRVYVQPLSRFRPPEEKSLLVIEPKVWTSPEQASIVAYLTSGRISTDLATVVRGTEQDVKILRKAQQAK